MRYALLALLTFAAAHVHAEPPSTRVTRNLDPRGFLFSPEVVADRDRIRLARSVLIADEMGATDFNNTVSLSDRVWARKTFDLDRREADAAELFIFGDTAQITVNGMPLAKTTDLFTSGWKRIKVPTELLRTGANEVIFRGVGSLLVEPTARPGRSARSTDGGKTWSSDDVGGKGTTPGEYVVRLRLARHARKGWAMSPVIDLWTEQHEAIGTPGRAGRLHALGGLGAGITSAIRTGATPTPDDRWTGWLPLDREPAPAEAKHRWAQLRFELATDNPLSSPSLPFALTYDFTADPTAPGEVTRQRTGGLTPPARLAASLPFIYQAPSARLQRLRERHQLDKVIVPGKTEMEQLVLLRHWVRHQWHTAWEGTGAGWMPPWDALIILDSKDKPDCLTMCTHYAAVYTQCCLALGWTARHCILDHHCVSEVYVNEQRKWVMMDPGNSKERPDCNLHYERAGVPQSALELHLALRDKKTEALTVCFTPPALAEKIKDLCRPMPPLKVAPPPRPAQVPVAELPKYPVCGIENFRRCAFPARNNYLDSLFPGELYQGWSHYFYDGYCWVGDSPDRPERSPEYTRHLDPARPQDIDWPLNETRIHLARTNKAGELAVVLETVTPNLARLEMHTGDGKWQATPAEFTWKLRPGKNTLHVRSINKFDRPGVENHAAVEWK